MGNTGTITSQDRGLDTSPRLKVSCAPGCHATSESLVIQGQTSCVCPSYESLLDNGSYPGELPTAFSRAQARGGEDANLVNLFAKKQTPLVSKRSAQELDLFYLCADGRPMRNRGNFEIGQKQHPKVTALLADPCEPLVLQRKHILLMPAEICRHELSCRLACKAKDEQPVRGAMACICLNIKRSTLESRMMCVEHSNNEVECISGIRHTRRCGLRGESDEAQGQEEIGLKLSFVNQRVHVIFFVVTLSVSSVSDVTGLHFKVVDVANGKELFCFEKINDMPANGVANGVALAMLIRDGSDWYFVAIDESFEVPMMSSYYDLLPQLRKLVSEDALQAIWRKLLN
eukprot:gnl/TRDRNA2_/TRDRNA2_191962_c0_seq1.p1 gnl/TRDRNA2_/TRDRNA2_191962_c0~~gnl/TRDRNA2_/TRDRNA2_191962_c0_seq1.p1  ORF type:complete len:344 (-),score=42.39 gnl/TRDRNA2_/TRDRNA2_191962_c0_seq1:92-1123(-)